MRIARSGALVAALLVLLPVSAAPLGAQGRPFGPLHFEEGGPLQRISYTPMTEIADPIPAGTFQANLWMAYSNIFDADSTATHDLYLDLERLLTMVGVRYGVTDDLEAGVRMTTATTGGGFLDDFLTAWHHLLHVGNADRSLYPENAYGQRLVGPRGKVLLNIPRHTFGLEDVRLFAKWKAWESADSRRLVSVRAVARIPSQSNRDEGQRADVALMALGRMSWTRWDVHGMVGGSTVKFAGDLAPLVRSSAWFGSLALERSLRPWLSGVVQYSLATPRLHAIGDPQLDGPSGNFVFGVTGSKGRSWLWDVSFQEDIPPGSPAADFTLGIRLSRRW